jgi:FtsP/CotA-like multicopper oxidase with cupredoxin domain
MNRRNFLASSGLILADQMLAQATPAWAKRPAEEAHAHYALRIAPCKLEIAAGIVIETLGYNGQVPGPIQRVREGVPVTIDVTNQTAAIDSRNDGAMEEGSPMIPASGRLRYHFTPRPAGTRWYHTHAPAGTNLSIGTYTGQFGFLMVEGAQDPGHYDQELFFAIHHWEPSFVPMVEAMRQASANAPLTSDSDVGYKFATINQHMLGAGEPIRVKRGQHVLMHLLNASATENVVLALPGHTFKVIAMDGNPVPSPVAIESLSLAVAERIDAIVEMNAPGVWILGSMLARSRAMGLGTVIEYAGATGTPAWRDPLPPSGTTRNLPIRRRPPIPMKHSPSPFATLGQ